MHWSKSIYITDLYLILATFEGLCLVMKVLFSRVVAKFFTVIQNVAIIYCVQFLRGRI